jgi:hypothetical protein
MAGRHLDAQVPRPDARAMAEAVSAMEELDALRSGLAGTIAATGAAVDQQTFAQVCKPVGIRAREIGERHGWRVVQMSERNRNPKHGLDRDGRLANRVFQRHPEALSLWLRTEGDGRSGMRYFRRITVEKACLSCHGPKEARPEFIRTGYPQDRAYGYREGDLRGVYAVFIPDASGPLPAD